MRSADGLQRICSADSPKRLQDNLWGLVPRQLVLTCCICCRTVVNQGNETENQMEKEMEITVSGLRIRAAKCPSNFSRIHVP